MSTHFKLAARLPVCQTAQADWLPFFRAAKGEKVFALGSCVVPEKLLLNGVLNFVIVLAKTRLVGLLKELPKVCLFI